MKQGIRAVNTQVLAIQDCDFLEVKDKGITIFIYITMAVTQTSTIISIEHCRFNGGEFGIDTINTQNVSILDCEFQNIKQSSIEMYPRPKYAQYLQPLYIADIWIENCTIVGGDIGVEISGLLPYHQQLQLYGAIIQTTSNVSVSIRNCQFMVGARYGISIWNTFKLSIQRCEFQANETNRAGINIENTENTLVQDSAFVGLKQAGIRTVNTQVLSIQGCEFLNIEYLAIYSFYFTTNAVIQYSNTILVQNCRFIGGKYGIVTLNAQNASILNCKFQDVEGSIEVGTLARYFQHLQPTYNGDIWIQNCTIAGGAIGVEIWRIRSIREQLKLFGSIIQTRSNVSVLIQRTTIYNTYFNGIFLYSVNNGTITECAISDSLNQGIFSFNSHSTIAKTNITGNRIGLLSQPTRTLLGSASVNNCIFSENIEVGMLLIESDSPTGIVVTNCSFYDNRGTPIAAYHSGFQLRGKNIFRDNIAERRGGLALHDSSKVIFSPGSNTTFINNTAAEFGGAIYITSQFGFLLSRDIRYTFRESPVDFEPCFYFVTNDSDSSINFINNKATLGGLDIYGAIPYKGDCKLSAFKLQSKPSNSFKVSSDPTRVCFCVNNSPQCENRTYFMLNETRYPGETFTISVALAGYNFGRVAGSVYANVLGREYREVIREGQHVQTVDLLKCGTLSYTVFSNNIEDPVVLVLSVLEQLIQEQDDEDIQHNIRDIYSKRCSENRTFPCTAVLYTPVYINVTLEPCPLGFDLDLIDRICKCEHNINSTNSMCKILDHTGYITREGTVWVGVDTSGNNTDIYYWHRYCHRHYCTASKTAIDLRSPDKQCSLNRSGLLCGSCQAGLSLQLGGNKCIQCNNNYIALLIVFAILGILLVAVIKLLDLTITSGTINGLIFYANVVWRNNAILFSLQDRQNIGYYIITLPIAWINLDFGIETYFSENLDQLTKTGLQFVFPVYIWCIAGLIIIISHYSTRATKLFGNNSVAVLATLFLLSYAKSYYQPLRWTNTLKPFFDTYYGPFKDKKQHQVWTGILLISRVLILVVYASTSTYSPNANILLMTLISTLLFMYSSMVGLLYKKWTLSFLESLYLLNLMMLGGSFLFYQLSISILTQQHNELNPVATTSVVTALFLFVCAVIINTTKRVMSTDNIHRYLKGNEGGVISNQGALQVRPSAPTVQVVELKKYDSSVFREELLETVP